MRRIVATALGLSIVAAFAVTSGTADTSAAAFDIVRVGSGGFGEPGINIGDDGAIYVDAPTGAPTHSRMWRSNNGGYNYTAVNFNAPFNRFPGGGDSDIALRGTRVYFLDLWVGSNAITISEDGGQTWTTGTPFTSLPLSDRQWIALGPQDPLTGLDTVYVLYALIQDPRQVMLARSRTGGLTWDAHIPVPAFAGATGYTGQLVSDGKNTLAFVWEDARVLSSAVSTDGGDTWRTKAIASNVLNVIPGVAMDGQDIHAAWIDRSWRAHTATSRDLGMTWSVPQVVSAPDTTNIFAWVDTRGDKVAVAWYGADVPSQDPNTVPADTVWSVRYTESLDNGGTFDTSISVEPAKTGIICTRGLGCDGLGTVGRELADFLSVAIAADGRSIIVFGGQVPGGIRSAVQRPSSDVPPPPA
ncbi:MAG TPA: sialidase family protein, partial [Actinomycetota bacterium]|nr:sialidase family protein [Actinomycetota bacterium]